MQEHVEGNPPGGPLAPPVDVTLYTLGLLVAVICPNTEVGELIEALALGYYGLPQAQWAAGGAEYEHVVYRERGIAYHLGEILSVALRGQEIPLELVYHAMQVTRLFR